MSKFETIKGMMKTFFWLVGEEWNEMDHKLLRIAGSIFAFIIAALFWYFLLRNIMPF